MRRFAEWSKAYGLFVLVFAIICLWGYVRSSAAEPRYPGAEIVEKAAFSNITSNATTLVKSGAGSLAAITVNGGTMGAITVYDSLTAAGTKIATVASPVAGMVLPYGVRFSTGLTIVTADNTNLTVSYY